MKSFVCVVLLAACVVAAPEGKRDKRGYLLGSSYDSLDHYSLDHSFAHSLPYTGSYDSFYDHASVIAPSAKIISVNKVVEIPKVVEVKKIVSVPKVVSVPQVVKVAKVVHAPHYSYAPLTSSGWW